MNKHPHFDKKNSLKAAQLLVTMVVALMMGTLISSLPVMSQIDTVLDITAAQIILFFSRLIALVLFFTSGIFIKTAFPDDEGAFAFVKSIIIPTTTLIMLIIGQRLIWQMVEPYTEAIDYDIYSRAAIALILLVTSWLLFSAYRNIPFLITTANTTLIPFTAAKKKRSRKCSECLKNISSQAKFCLHCGHKVTAKLTCHQCSTPIFSGQHFCSQCGVPTESDLVETRTKTIAD